MIDFHKVVCKKWEDRVYTVYQIFTIKYVKVVAMLMHSALWNQLFLKNAIHSINECLTLFTAVTVLGYFAISYLHRLTKVFAHSLGNTSSSVQSEQNGPGNKHFQVLKLILC